VANAVGGLGARDDAESSIARGSDNAFWRVRRGTPASFFGAGAWRPGHRAQDNCPQNVLVRTVDGERDGGSMPLRGGRVLTLAVRE
jgi:hypothetical protein